MKNTTPIRSAAFVIPSSLSLWAHPFEISSPMHGEKRGDSNLPLGHGNCLQERRRQGVDDERRNYNAANSVASWFFCSVMVFGLSNSRVKMSGLNSFSQHASTGVRCVRGECGVYELKLKERHQ